MKTWQYILTLLAFCGTGVLLLLIFLGYVLKIPEKAVPGISTIAVQQLTVPPIDPSRDTIIGNKTAPVTIVAYMDFGCAHCKVMSERIESLVPLFPNVIRLVWKDLPRTAQQGSVEAHIAARCAYEQNKFSEYRNLVYTNQPNFSATQLRMNASALGLNLPRFTACQEREDHRKRFADIKGEVEALGITATPTLFINNQRVEGEVTIETLKNIIETEKKKGKK